MADLKGKKVIALRFMADGDLNYVPGDEITEGQLYENAEHYAANGSVEIRNEDGSMVEAEPTETDEERRLRELREKDALSVETLPALVPVDVGTKAQQVAKKREPAATSGPEPGAKGQPAGENLPAQNAQATERRDPTKRG